MTHSLSSTQALVCNRALHLVFGMAFLLCTAGVAAGQAAFDKMHLDAAFYAEGGAIGDLNGDGAADLVAGPYWYAGPTFDRRHAFYEPKPFSIEGFSYSDNFVVHTHDLNNDGWRDILVIGFPGREAFWYENPGDPDRGETGYWTRHLAFAPVDNESPHILDITGDGRPEIVCHSDGYLGYASYDPERPTEPWTFRQVAGPYEHLMRFTHGFGAGDVNGDGLPDLLMATGWWENPGFHVDTSWKRHEASFAQGGAQMYAYDVDGDGLNDVITSHNAHGWGLAWFRQLPEGGFEKRLILRDDAARESGKVRFSQLHAVALVDMNNDGLKDIVTGKRFRAHGEAMDPEPNAPPVLYWFQLARDEDGQVVWIPHLVDDDSGVGVALAVDDANGDDYPDILVVNKKGAYIFRQHRP